MRGFFLPLCNENMEFGLFERPRMDTKGPGVGLALVKPGIEVHGGEVWIEADGPGAGTMVFFILRLI